ncbi:UNVERIFIED_CONTAM: hypothetical protein RKD43_001855 [Streptomyces graminofaciens]
MGRAHAQGQRHGGGGGHDRARPAGEHVPESGVQHQSSGPEPEHPVRQGGEEPWPVRLPGPRRRFSGPGTRSSGRSTGTVRSGRGGPARGTDRHDRGRREGRRQEGRPGPRGRSFRRVRAVPATVGRSAYSSARSRPSTSRAVADGCVEEGGEAFAGPAGVAVALGDEGRVVLEGDGPVGTRTLPHARRRSPRCARRPARRRSRRCRRTPAPRPGAPRCRRRPGGSRRSARTRRGRRSPRPRRRCPRRTGPRRGRRRPGTWRAGGRPRCR